MAPISVDAGIWLVLRCAPAAIRRAHELDSQKQHRHNEPCTADTSPNDILNTISAAAGVGSRGLQLAITFDFDEFQC